MTTRRGPYNGKTNTISISIRPVVESASELAKPVWKILYYFIMYSDVSLFLLFSCQFSVSHKTVDISVLTWIGSAPPCPSGSAHLFGINEGVPVCVELVLI
jgi:hypothetical protein